ncbi:hypothetical protein Desor_1563 [Desulfosporosinus orientis DSM 765]|uniref:DUF5714 domain-containing protein n=1 Tax=Desulfosporosinus orientis (strain ATCC 19365 / DSM 765 / NCIMB 8382 / VKM B-1628 / Singapore I) TaxID=768706 RepID=G7WD18_DESOD|nr:DUF5714 domain-containing protein [Desulfosporosinus orientis]AET67213.1 hypothetical protein Desor_1563 [Desulfosporosinus orientis DSM 765]
MDYFSSGREFTCFNCGKTEIGNIYCLKGHYICDECHGKDLFDRVKEYVLASESPNPFEIAEHLMNQENVPMLGCENAWIAAGALMAALKNEGTSKITEEQIVEALNRTKRQAIGGYCGLTGVCGIAPAIGACFSVIIGAACSKDQETVVVMRVVARIVDTIANETGPCCCKSFVRTALSEAIRSVKRYLNVSLPLPNEVIICSHSARHPHGCRESKCLYFNK